MNALEHAHHARMLIDACGGLAPASKVCRVSESKLSDYQNPNVVLFMPADVMADLESYCGKRIYSRALFDQGPADTAQKNPLQEAVEGVAAMSKVLTATSAAMADGSLTGTEKREILAAIAATKSELNEIAAAVLREDAA